MHDGLIQLHTRLHPFRQRIRLLLAERYACWGVAVTGGVAMLLVLIDLLTVWYVTPAALLGLVALGVLAGVVAALVRPLPPMAIAATVEQRRNLKERASTALALHGDPHADAAFRDAITADALTALEPLTPRELFPLRLTRRHLIATGAWVVVVALLLVPALPWFKSPQQQAERLALREAGKILQQQAKQMQQDPQVQQDKTAKQVARNMQKLGIELEKQRIPRREALMRMHKLEEELAKLEHDLAAKEQAALKPAAAAARKAAEVAKQQGKSAKSAKAAAEAKARQQRLEQIAANLEAGNLPAAMDELQQLGEELQQAELSDAERKALAEALEKLAQAAPTTTAASQASTLKQAAKSMSQHSKPGQCKSGQCLAKLSSGKCKSGNCSGNAKNAVASARKGMSGQGQGQGQGQAQGQGQGQGQGQSMSSGGMPGGSPGGGPGMINQSDRPSERLNGVGVDPQRQQAAMNSDAQAYAIDVRGAPDQLDRTNVPYYEVYSDYRKSAEQAIRTEEIPLTERQRVKDYFDALDPASGSGQ